MTYKSGATYILANTVYNIYHACSNGMHSAHYQGQLSQNSGKYVYSKQHAGASVTQCGHHVHSRGHNSHKREHNSHKRWHNLHKRRHNLHKRWHNLHKRRHNSHKREHNSHKREHQANSRNNCTQRRWYHAYDMMHGGKVTGSRN